MVILALLASIYSIPVLSFAQTGENETVLEGKWVLESASIQEITGRDTLKADADDMKNGIPLGKWEVTQVAIEKNYSGKVENTAINSVNELKSHIPCLQDLELNATTATLRYPDGREETVEYAIEGGQLILYTASETQKFQYSTIEGNLTLTAVYNYVNNDLKAKRSEDIREQRIIYLKTK